MEKRTPDCNLAVVRGPIAAGKVRITVSALIGGAAMGFDFEEIIGVVVALTPRLLQEYDDTRRSPHLAGRLAAKDAGRRGVPEAYGPGRFADRVIQRAIKKGALP